MYSYADALRYVLTEHKKDLITVEEGLREAKQKALIGYAKFNMWSDVNSNGTVLMSQQEVDKELSNISEEWIHKNEDLVDIYSKKIEVYQRQIRWLEGRISYYDREDLKSKEQRDKEDQDRRDRILKSRENFTEIENMDELDELLKK